MSAEMYVSPRSSNESLSTDGDELYDHLLVDKQQVTSSSVAYLPESGQIVRLLSTTQVPKGVIPEGCQLFLCELICQVD